MNETHLSVFYSVSNRARGKRLRNVSLRYDFQLVVFVLSNILYHRALRACQFIRLLLRSPLFCLFSFFFYSKTVARASVATLWNNLLVQNQVNAHVRRAHKKYARLQKSGGVHAILVTNLYFIL